MITTQMLQNYTKKSRFGFTLLELLVVISIIGILIAISAAAFTTAQQKARNAKRSGDLNAMSKAFEQYYANSATSSYVANCGIAMGASLPGGVFPRDPKTGNNYGCTSTASTYCICATLEPANTNSGNSSLPQNATCSGIGTAGPYYCVRNQQ